ncbi:LysR family transcriptional regulator [Ruegeria sp. HKCCD8929]|uniref:LysR family transcriptional regulator n=1 Tax=Ruegeria sp. HKCCD8929 TaxID=2683006 RepID=UPI001488054C|nr:LysR family transcriptional regulator [Ruegeria sp. HKCCD8929]
MARTTHLNALQALEMAIREGSLRGAAEKLGITPAAVGQRIRALEKFLDTDLILRGRSGLRPTPALEGALDDLHAAFSALDRVAASLDFQRTTEIHIIADPDWSDLWLLPRLGRFRTEHPNILFNINGEGDVPMRLGAADLFIDRDPQGRAASGDELYTEVFLPIGSPENAARVADPFATKAADTAPQYLPVGTIGNKDRVWRHSQQDSIEGFPLLHLQDRPTIPETPGWADWLAVYPHDRTSPERGVQYAHVRNAIDGVKSDAGLLVCGLSLVLDDIEAGLVSLPFPSDECLAAKHPYCVKTRTEATVRPQVTRLIAWLKAEAAITRVRMEALTTA